MNVMNWSDWLALLAQFILLSFMSVGGAITTIPEMHRYLVVEHFLLSDRQFNASIAIAQASPGPNVLFVAILGWNVGLNTGSTWAALLGMLVTMGGIMLPAFCITYFAARWTQKNRERRIVIAFKQGLAPVVVALLLASAWVLASSAGSSFEDWKIWLVIFVTILLIWNTRVHILWLLGAAGVLGWFGVV